MSQSEIELQKFFDKPELSDWRLAVEKVLKGRTVDTLTKQSLEKIAIKPLYTEGPKQVDSGFPDFPPYTRGTGALDRRQAGWDIRQSHTFGSLENASKAIEADLKRGVRSLWLYPVSKREEAAGILTRNLSDFLKLLDKVDLGHVPVAIDAGSDGLVWFVALIAAASEKGVELKQLTGAIYADPFEEIAIKGSFPHSLDEHWSSLAAMLKWSKQKAPWLHLVTCSSLPYHDAGAHSAQELAFLLSSAVTALRELTSRGIEFDDLEGRFAVKIGVGRDLFMEIAKIRAFRLLWAKLLRHCGAGDSLQKVFIHACTGRRTQSKRDPWVNMLRATAEGFSASTAGADALTILPFDRVFGASGELANRVASNAQTVLEKESHLAKVVDPAGGSWYIEALTEQLAKQAWSLFQEIEKEGGLLKALQTSKVQSDISEVVVKRRENLAKRKDSVLGVNEFANLAEEALKREELAPSDPPILWKEIQSDSASLKAVHEYSQIDVEQVQLVLETVQKGNLFEDVKQALWKGSEMIVGAGLKSFRYSEDWELLRDASDRFLAKHSSRPKIFCINLGELASYKPRLEFARRFFETGGFEVIDSGGFTKVDAALSAFRESGAKAFVFCGSDDSYESYVFEFLKAFSSEQLCFSVLAGRAGKSAESWRKEGLTDFISLRCDALSLLQEFQKLLGVE